MLAGSTTKIGMPINFESPNSSRPNNLTNPPLPQQNMSNNNIQNQPDQTRNNSMTSNNFQNQQRVQPQVNQYHQSPYSIQPNMV